MTFFCKLSSIKKSKFLHAYYSSVHYQPTTRRKKNLIKPYKIKLLILYYNVHSETERTLLLIMNATEIYERSKLRALSPHSPIVGWLSVIILCNDTDKTYTHLTNQHAQTSLPSHFNSASLTVAAFDNFDHLDKNSLFVMENSHDTEITLFQIKRAKKNWN